MRSQAIIDLGQLINNYKIYSSNLIPNCKVMAVVKANAYGHGDVQVAKTLAKEGVNDFAVSNIDEAIRLRTAGITGQILILGFTSVDRANELIRFDITQALISEDYANALAQSGLQVKSQFAVDTGMRRIGLNADNPELCENVIRKYAPKLKINGLFTHLCVADANNEESIQFTKRQIDKFQMVVKRIEDLNFPYIHYMNSAAGIWHQEGTSTFARLGIILYGLKPDYTNTLPAGIKPILTWKSIVSMVKEVKIGDTIGYGNSFTVRNAMIVATVSTGYADGYSRLLSNIGYVLINGKRAPIIGRICMDQFMVDVTHIKNVHMGTEVVLIGNNGTEIITADDIANQIGTIGYEIVCAISERVERLYTT